MTVVGPMLPYRDRAQVFVRPLFEPVADLVAENVYCPFIVVDHVGQRVKRLDMPWLDCPLIYLIWPNSPVFSYDIPWIDVLPRVCSVVLWGSSGKYGRWLGED